MENAQDNYGAEAESVHGDAPSSILETKITMFRDLVQPAFVQETEDTLRYRRYWSKAGNIADILGKLCIVVATILAFMTFYTDDDKPRKGCAFTSGVLGIIALTLMYFEARAKNSVQESSNRIAEMYKNSA